MSEAGNNLLQIARVLKSNGTEGEVVFSFRDILPEDLDTKEPVFIVFDGLPVPFYIQSFEGRGNRAFVRLNDVSCLEDAEELAGKAVFADASGYEDEEDGMPAIIGWTLKNEEGKICGVISDFEDIPGNPCIYVRASDGSESMLPLHDDLITDIDEDESILTMRIPDGLL